MDQPLLLALIVAVAVAIAALLLVRLRRPPAAPRAAEESPLAVSTEGMKVCPKCGMGNLWTASRCSACGSALRG